MPAGQRAGAQARCEDTLIEGHRTEDRGSPRGCDLRAVVDAQRALLPDQITDGAHASHVAKTLPGRRDLKRAYQDEQARVEPVLRAIVHPVAHPQRAADGRLGLDRQAPIAKVPDDARHRHPAVFQRLVRLDIGPSKQPVAGEDHGFETERGLARLHHAVGVDECAFGAVRGANRCPFRLLTVQPARMPATRFAGGNGIPERIDGTRELEGLEPQCRAARGLRELEPHEAGAQIRQVDIASPAAGVRCLVHRGPPLTAERGSHSKSAGGRFPEPIDDQAADGPGGRRVDHDPRFLVRGLRLPPSPRQGIGRRVPRQRARGLRARGQRGREVAHFEVADEQRPLAALAGHDGELDEAELRDAGAARGPPRKIDIPALDLEALPAPRRHEVLENVPPHIEPARIDELELEVVRRASPAQPQAHGIVLGHGAIDGVARDHEALAALEVKIHPQGAGRGRSHRAEAELGVAGDGGDPFRGRHGSAAH